MLNKNKSLTVFVPALNEEMHVEFAIASILEALKKTVPEYEVFIVNDGSSDKTGEIINNLSQKISEVRALHHPRQRGLGAAYQSAVAASTKNYFVFVPGDNSWPYDSLVQLFSLTGEADIITSYATNPWARRGGPPRMFISSGYTKFLNALYSLDMKYFNGLTIYPAQFLKTNPVKTFGFGFAAEALLHGIYRGMNFIEIGLPIQELDGGLSKALTFKNFVSVIKAISNCFWEIRVQKIYGNTVRGQRFFLNVSEYRTKEKS